MIAPGCVMACRSSSIRDLVLMACRLSLRRRRLCVSESAGQARGSAVTAAPLLPNWELRLDKLNASASRWFQIPRDLPPAQRRASLKIGVISDTHGLLRPEVAPCLAGASHIIHAGDIGAARILDVMGCAR